MLHLDLAVLDHWIRHPFETEPEWRTVIASPEPGEPPRVALALRRGLALSHPDVETTHPFLAHKEGLIVDLCSIEYGPARVDVLRVIERAALAMQKHYGWVLFQHVALPLFYAMTRRHGYVSVCLDDGAMSPAEGLYGEHSKAELEDYFPILQRDAMRMARWDAYGVLWYPPKERTLRFASAFLGPLMLRPLETLFAAFDARGGSATGGPYKCDPSPSHSPTLPLVAAPSLSTTDK